MSTSEPQLARLLSRIALSQILIFVFAVLVFDSMPMFLLILGGIEEVSLTTIGRAIRSLWPIAVTPLVGLRLCWRWRTILRRRLRKIDGDGDTTD
jgi:hypothetical protein